MIGSAKRRVAALAMAGAALVVSTGAVAAMAPTVDVSTVHVERPFFDCADFSVVGVWDITHRLTIFYDTSGTPIRDIEEVEFIGRLVNGTTGAWVPDSGLRRYFDTLAPDGSFLTTYAVEVRKSDYVHMAGRTDFQTGGFTGRYGFGDASVAAVCEALGG